MIERVITNPSDNALRHTPAGGCVEAAPSLRGDHVVVRVSDTGCGMAPSERERIFERFYRNDTARTTTATSGAGLDLAIVQKILALHGCSIAVETGEGKGATFVFDLPTTQPPRRARVRHSEPAIGTSVRGAAAGAKPAAEPARADVTNDLAPSNV